MNSSNLVDQIIEFVGGSQNVKHVTHCATHLRITLYDENNIQKDRIDALDGVLGSVKSGGQYQIIIGQNVGQVYDDFVLALGKENSSELEPPENEVKKEKKFSFSKTLDTISGIFTPILPAITAAAMVKTLLVILNLFNILDQNGGTYKILTFAGDTAFYFMPVLVAFSASNKFRRVLL